MSQISEKIGIYQYRVCKTSRIERRILFELMRLIIHEETYLHFHGQEFVWMTYGYGPSATYRITKDDLQFLVENLVVIPRKRGKILMQIKYLDGIVSIRNRKDIKAYCRVREKIGLFY